MRPDTTGYTALVALALLAAPSPAAGQDAPEPETVVTGEVRGLDGDGPRALGHALVELVVDGRVRRSVLADESGRYRLTGVGRGVRTVRAIHVGYAPVEVEVLVPNGGTVQVDLELETRPVPVPGVSVVVEPLHIPEAGRRDVLTEEAEAVVGLAALEASPGLAEAGVGRAVGVPGNEPADPDQVLFMRGSTTDLKLVLLDGAPVYTPFHVAGLIRSFDASGLGGATHHVGGAPARYDGGLSYILDLRTRPVRRDRPRASGSADLLSLQGSVETPLGERAGVRVQARRLHATQSRLAGGTTSPYGYRDALLRAEVDVGDAGELALTAFLNDESVRLDVPPTAGSAGLDEASWGNDALAAAFRGRAGGLELDVGLAATRYQAELPVVAPRTSSSEETATEGTVLARGTTERTRLTVDAARRGRSGALRMGAAFDRLSLRYGTRPLLGAAPEPTTLDTEGTVVGAYVDGIRRLAPEVDLRWGLRLDHFQPGGARGALRLALMWSPSDDALITLAGGRYHQLTRLGDTDQVELALGDGMEVGTAPVAASPDDALLRVASADHLVLSLEQLLEPPVRLTLEGFYKSFRGIAGAEGGRLASSGVDLRIAREGDVVTGWLGYSIAWFWETAGRSDGGFSGRHLLTAGVRSELPGSTGLDLRFALSDGLPLTAVSLGDPDPSDPAVPDEAEVDPLDEETDPLRQPTDGFLRVDAELYAVWTPSVGGRTMNLRPYFRILNALDRRDALFHHFDRWRSDELKPLAELSLVPVLGIEWRF